MRVSRKCGTYLEGYKVKNRSHDLRSSYTFYEWTDHDIERRGKLRNNIGTCLIHTNKLYVKDVVPRAATGLKSVVQLQFINLLICCSVPLYLVSSTNVFH